MNHNPKVCLFDALSACKYIIDFTTNISYEDYLGDAKTRFAVERQFEILGEALNRVKKLSPDLLDRVTDWQEVIAFRNIVIHAYDKLNDGIVFDAAINDIPPLQIELENILKDLDNK
jgi:uncharacterized protein with HEPN domain